MSSTNPDHICKVWMKTNAAGLQCTVQGAEPGPDWKVWQARYLNYANQWVTPNNVCQNKSELFFLSHIDLERRSRI